MAPHSKSAIRKWMAIPKHVGKKIMYWDQHRMNTLLSVFLSSFGVHSPLLYSPPGYSFTHLLKPSMKIRQGSCARFSLFYTWKLALLSAVFSPGRQVSQVAKWSLPSEESALASCLSAGFFTGLVLKKFNIFISLSFSIGTGRVLWKKNPRASVT